MLPMDMDDLEPPLPDTNHIVRLPEKSGNFLRDVLAKGAEAIPKPSAAAIENYLQQKERSAASLLAAWQVSGATNYLQEAAQQFANDPHVQFAVLASNVFPDDRGNWIALFKQSCPDNPLANYFAAHEDFLQGQTEAAVTELKAAAGKEGFEDYITDFFWPECEQLSLATGAPPALAEWEGVEDATRTVLPCLSTLRALAREAAAAQTAFASAGDSASAQSLAQTGVVLGQQLNVERGGELVINQLVGIAIEAIFLSQLPPDETLDWLGQSPAERRAELNQQKEQLRNLTTTIPALLPQLSDAELTDYLDRWKQSGELAAMKWLAARVPTQPQPTPPN